MKVSYAANGEHGTRVKRDNLWRANYNALSASVTGSHLRDLKSMFLDCAHREHSSTTRTEGFEDLCMKTTIDDLLRSSLI